MGERPGRDIIGKWLHFGGTVVQFLLKLNGPEVRLCADSGNFISLNFSNKLLLAIISIPQIQGPTCVNDLLDFLVLTSLQNRFTFSYLHEYIPAWYSPYPLTSSQNTPLRLLLPFHPWISLTSVCPYAWVTFGEEYGLTNSFCCFVSLLL